MDTWLKRLLTIVQIVCMPVGAFLGIYGAFFKKVPIEVVSRNKSIDSFKVVWIHYQDWGLITVGLIIIAIGGYLTWRKMKK